MLALDPRNGDVLWDAIVNAPHGRTELERLADIDSPARVAGDDVFVVGYQGRVAMLARDSGQIWWGRDTSSYRGLAMDERQALCHELRQRRDRDAARDGTVLWEQDALKRRGLTAPALAGDALVVGDFEGYLHWLDKATGEIVARAEDRRRAHQQRGGRRRRRLFVQTDSGNLRSQRCAERSRSAEGTRLSPLPTAGSP